MMLNAVSAVTPSLVHLNRSIAQYELKFFAECKLSLPRYPTHQTPIQLQGRVPIEAEPENAPIKGEIYTEALCSSDGEEETKFKLYHLYKSAAEIDYHLDGAVKQGFKLIIVLDTLIKALQLSAPQKEIWDAEIQRCVLPSFRTHK